MRGRKRIHKNRAAAVKAADANKIKGKYWRLVIPALDLETPPSTATLDTLKSSVLQLLQKHEKPRGLQKYLIAVETHPVTKLLHLDILLIYKQRINNTPTHYDYIIKHGDLTKYSKLNEAIMTYGLKEDPQPLKNFSPEVQIRERVIQEEPYKLLRQAMLEDPFHFQPHSWLLEHNLDLAASKGGWSSAISLVKKQQEAECNRRLRSKPGFQKITRELIEQTLSREQLKSFDSWEGFSTIVDKLNQIVQYGSYRPFKTKQLLIVGPAHIGKTSIISEPSHKRQNPSVQDCASVYHMGMKHWFPKYQSGIYKCILWDQFKLTAYAYDTILKLLQGSPIDLPYHGGATKKDDNPLIVMTSNLPLERHICIKFTDENDRIVARQNLKYRIAQLHVPEGKDLFILRKLIKALEG